MSTSIEIEVESEKCDCCADCKMGGSAAPAKPAPSKDALLAELKNLLNETSTNGMAERQLKIDELMSTISELGD